MPKTFTDRRAVLKTLQNITQNDVEVFRKLRDNSSFIVVTTKVESATKAIHDSPYQRTILSQGLDDPSNKSSRATWGALYNIHSTITSPLNPIPADRTGGGLAPPPGSRDANPADTVSQRTFTIRCFPANKDFDHYQMVRQDPLNGPWPDVGGIETYTSAALRQSVPAGHMAAGLRDWESGRQMLRDSSSFVDEDAHGASAVLLGRTIAPSSRRGGMGHILERMRVRNKQGGTPEIMKGLAAFAKRAQRKTDTKKRDSADFAKSENIAVLDMLNHDRTESSGNKGSTVVEEVTKQDSSGLATHKDVATTGETKHSEAANDAETER